MLLPYSKCSNQIEMKMKTILEIKDEKLSLSLSVIYFQRQNYFRKDKLNSKSKKI